MRRVRSVNLPQPAATNTAPHLEAHRRAALLHRLHGILDLKDAALGAPRRHVGVILHGTERGQGQRKPRSAVSSGAAVGAAHSGLRPPRVALGELRSLQPRLTPSQLGPAAQRGLMKTRV